MLEELRVSDVALVHSAQFELRPGLTVFTGETGAGKTALLSAMKLLIGARADSTMVREGAAEAVAEARFFSEGEEIVVRRRLSADGRSRCYLDGGMATVGELAASIGPLVDLHGQHEHQSLLNTATHVAHLDRWIGEEARRAHVRYTDARAEFRAAEEELARVVGEIDQAREEIELHRLALEQILAVDPAEREYEELSARLPLLQHSERLAELVGGALDEVRRQDGASESLARALVAVEKARDYDVALEPVAERFVEIAASVEELAVDLRTYRDALPQEGDELQRTLDRLGSIDGLVKRFGPRIEDVFRRKARALHLLSVGEAGEDIVSDLRDRLEHARRAYVTAAEALDTLRISSAPSFADEITRAFSDLGMPGASVQVRCLTLEFERWGASGPSHVEFVFSPSPDVSHRSLAKIASGGEVSRVMLALKGALNDESARTLVFDEIDAGIGGATARAVGARLKALSRTHQVLVVTHLAQVASFADDHFLVEKCPEEQGVRTSVRRIDGECRVAEIARMLSGTNDETATAHARALLAEASE